MRGVFYDLQSKTDSLQSQPTTGQQLKRDGETDDRCSNPKIFMRSPWHHGIHSPTYLLLENSQCLQITCISLSEHQPNTKVHEVICADDSVHDAALDQTVTPNARDEYLVNIVMDTNSTFFIDADQPTIREPATGAFSSPDVIIVHAALRDRYNLKPLYTLSSDHRQIIITVHLPTVELKRKTVRLILEEGVYGSLSSSS